MSKHLRFKLMGVVTFLTLLTIVALVAVVALNVNRHLFVQKPTIVRAGAQSSMMFGTNLGLYDATDQVVNNPATQDRLKALRPGIIRMPLRQGLDTVYIAKALRAIQYIGAAPMVIIDPATTEAAIEMDINTLSLLHTIFGAGQVYVEFGNEPDQAGISPEAYAAAWNTVAPRLQTFAPAVHFVGPAVSRAEPSYIATFDLLASPHPYANTWHEYVCHPSDDDAVCLSRIGGWITDTQDIQTAVQGALGRVIPSMITEWNLDADSDPRYSHPDYMRNWMTVALRTLVADHANGLLAAMQYCVTNHAQYQLIDSHNNLTPAGQAFASMRSLNGP